MPSAFKFVSRGPISDASRTRIEQAAASLGVAHVTIWSGVEFEENLRLRAEYLLHRFVQGIEFPDSETDIRKFVDDFPDLSDVDALAIDGGRVRSAGFPHAVSAGKLPACLSAGDRRHNWRTQHWRLADARGRRDQALRMRRSRIAPRTCSRIALPTNWTKPDGKF